MFAAGANAQFNTNGSVEMHDVMRERLWRKLQVLPDEQIYQVLDYIEFIESKYARSRAPEPDALQRFAEKFEDRMRDLAVAPRYIAGAVGMFGTANKVVKGVMDAGKEVVDAGIATVDAGIEMLNSASVPAQTTKNTQTRLSSGESIIVTSTRRPSSTDETPDGAA
jgi:hypothetical protein